MFIHPFIYLFVYLSIHRFIYLFIDLFIYLFVIQFFMHNKGTNQYPWYHILQNHLLDSLPRKIQTKNHPIDSPANVHVLYAQPSYRVEILDIFLHHFSYKEHYVDNHLYTIFELYVENRFFLFSLNFCEFKNFFLFCSQNKMC